MEKTTYTISAYAIVVGLLAAVASISIILTGVIVGDSTGSIWMIRVLMFAVILTAIGVILFIATAPKTVTFSGQITFISRPKRSDTYCYLRLSENPEVTFKLIVRDVAFSREGDEVEIGVPEWNVDNQIVEAEEFKNKSYPPSTTVPPATADPPEAVKSLEE